MHSQAMNASIGSLIKKRMEKLGLNQRALAVKAGLHPDAVRNILRGLSKHPRVDTAEKIFRALEQEEKKFGMSVTAHAQAGEPPSSWKHEMSSSLSPALALSPAMLVQATLLVQEIFAPQKLSPQDIEEVALKACRLAQEAGADRVTRHLVQYLLEISE